VTTRDSTNSTIADRVARLHEDLAGQIPGSVLAAFRAEQTGLEAAGIPSGSAKAGDTLPDAELLDVHGVSTTLAAARAGRPAVIVLYRGAWCPYCNLALRAYQNDLVPALDQRGVALIAISPQKPDGSLSMQEKNELSFTVLSDPGNQVAAALGVLTAPTDDARGAQRVIGVALTELNDDGTPGIPMPTVAVVDAAGIINWIDVHPNYTTRTEVADIISALATFG
jgi:peroxiredoxin